VGGAPDELTLKRNRDLEARRDVRWRRVGLVVLGLFLLLGLANLFGQRPGTATVKAKAASLSVYAPTRVRSGLYFEARFHVRAHSELKDAQLVLGSGWAEGMTINTIEPSPLGEASRNGDLALDLGHVPAGKSYVLYAQMQVNPTNVGRRSQRVELLDGDTRLLTVDRTITIFP